MKPQGKSETILLNLCGQGHFDLKAGQDSFDGNMVRQALTDAQIQNSLKGMDTPVIAEAVGSETRSVQRTPGVAIFWGTIPLLFKAHQPY